MSDLFDPDVELAELRELVLDFMPETGEIVGSTTIADGDGGQETQVESYGFVQCSKTALNGRDLATAAKLAPNASYRVSVPFGSPVAENRAIVIGDQRFEIVFVPANSYAAKIDCLCEVTG